MYNSRPRKELGHRCVEHRPQKPVQIAKCVHPYSLECKRLKRSVVLDVCAARGCMAGARDLRPNTLATLRGRRQPHPMIPPRGRRSRPLWG
eukprot:scaffold95504_cov34-Tisochrysis_lutea.AAC.3